MPCLSTGSSGSWSSFWRGLSIAEKIESPLILLVVQVIQTVA